MSILPLLLLVGVAFSKSFHLHGNDDAIQPIVSASQARRICASLCLSGLGGKACGPDCLDIMPDDMPAQSVNSSRGHSEGAVAAARTAACPVLCANKLGYPLCKCEDAAVSKDEIDYVQICGYVCIKLNYKIPGCQSCGVYKGAAEVYGADSFSIESAKTMRQIDWDEWCRQMCSVGDGGVACNCDILPMSAIV